MPADPPAVPHALDYEKRPSAARRWAWRLILIGLILVTAAVVYRYRREISDWTSLVTLRRAVLHHAAPPGTVLVRMLPDDRSDTWPANYVARYAPPDRTWQQAESRLVPLSTASPGSSVTAFLHERTSPSGNRRVVAINMAPTWGRDGVWLHFDVRLFEPGSWWRPRFIERAVNDSPDLRTSGSIPGFPGAVYFLGTVAWGSDFQLSAAVPDPKDRSRLMFVYVHNGVEGTVVMTLTDDDALRFSTLDGESLPLQLPAAAEIASPDVESGRKTE